MSSLYPPGLGCPLHGEECVLAKRPSGDGWYEVWCRRNDAWHQATRRTRLSQEALLKGLNDAFVDIGLQCPQA